MWRRNGYLLIGEGYRVSTAYNVKLMTLRYMITSFEITDDVGTQTLGKEKERVCQRE